MVYMMAIALLLSLGYAAFLLWCLSGWNVTKCFVPGTPAGGTHVTIIIPARNEEKNIRACLQDILNQKYPDELTEIIVVDDHSADRTAEYVRELIHQNPRRKLSLLHNRSAGIKLYKKQAISAAVQNARGELIITTDADCRMSNRWLESIVTYYEKHNPVMIVSPVQFFHVRNLFEQLQQLEFAGLVGIGAGAIAHHRPLLCNGANLAYTKKIFNEVNGFAGNETVSGDDTQLMLKVAEINPDGIHFLKSREAIVETSSMPSMVDLFHQRKRWASKIPKSMNLF